MSYGPHKRHCVFNRRVVQARGAELRYYEDEESVTPNDALPSDSFCTTPELAVELWRNEMGDNLRVVHCRKCDNFHDDCVDMFIENLTGLRF